MVFDITVAMTWLLFLALFPMAFVWLRRTWRIAVRRDYVEVALKRGVPPDDPEKFAPYSAAINLLAGVVVVTIIVGVLTASFDYATWSAMAGVTIWLKLIADFILSRHAHPFIAKSKVE
jgi:hypothetical protein